MKYRIYVTDSLRFVVGRYGGEYQRYGEWIDNKPECSKSGAEIASDVIKKAGLKVKY